MTAHPSFLRPETAALAPYNAGLSAEDVARRPSVTRVAKLGSNENPLGPAPGVRQALLARHADSDTLFCPAHFRGTSAGYVLRDGDAYRYRFLDQD